MIDNMTDISKKDRKKIFEKIELLLKQSGFYSVRDFNLNILLNHPTDNFLFDFQDW